METVDARGTKRTCQNNDCGARFYDLNRDPIICPICESKYVIAHAPAGAVIAETIKEKEVKRPPADAENEKAAPAEEGELADIEADDAIPDDDDESDAFLEDEEEDEGNVTEFIPGISDGEGEET
jgi:hypothetical protein